MSITLMRDLYEYHRWANRRLFDIATALGEDACARDLGTHWSVPTLARMFAHLYWADLNSLRRWKEGLPPTGLPFFDLGPMAEIRRAWDPLEAEQKGFVESLTEADLSRTVDFKNSLSTATQNSASVVIEYSPPPVYSVASAGRTRPALSLSLSR